MACNCGAKTYRPTLAQGPVPDLPEPTCTPDPGLWTEYGRRLTCLKTSGYWAKLNTSVAHINSYLGVIQTLLNSPTPCRYIQNLVHVEALLTLADERNIHC